MTPYLFHGPDARDLAQKKTLELGRMVEEPIGDAGLKVDDSRRIVERARFPGIGDKPPAVMVGPLDAATPEAADALLKTLEEISGSSLVIVLWADYLMGVIPTIRSRSQAIWCPPGKAWIDPLSWIEDPALKILKAYRNQNWFTLIGAVQEVGKDWPSLVRYLPSKMDPTSKKDVELWGRLRECQDGRGSYLSALDALLPSDFGE